MIIDEVHYAPGLFRHLKAAVDAHRGRRGQYLLTGSQKFTLMKGVSESLAGRADIVELETLSLREILKALPGTGIDSAIVHGGFPELHANPDIDFVAFYNSYLATYLERDIRSLANVGSLRDFERFLRACALRSANLLNKADLARDVGIAPSTANQWLSMLEASGQVVLLEPWFSNRTKSIVKSPKLCRRRSSSRSYATASAGPGAPAACFSGAIDCEPGFRARSGGQVPHRRRRRRMPRTEQLSPVERVPRIVRRGPGLVAARERHANLVATMSGWPCEKSGLGEQDAGATGRFAQRPVVRSERQSQSQREFQVRSIVGC